MTVLKTSIIFEKKWLATQIDAAAACPTLEGNDHVWRTVGRALATTEVMPFYLRLEFGVLATGRDFTVNKLM